MPPSSSLTSSASSSSLITVATCTLNQWALDFDGNVERIRKSCEQAKAAGAHYRLGPELEVSGYGCEDHFLEHDTFDHCWESLVYLLLEGCTDNLICDFGMPVLYKGTRYNCRVICYNQTILCIRPKTALADDGNYRESRYFTAYKSQASSQQNESLLLPSFVQAQLPNHQHENARSVPFGLSYVEFQDGMTLGCESCEELWTPQATHIELSLQGVLLIGNGSGSHHQLRKLDTRLDLIVNATKKCGGVYLYANQRGCDGGRLYYDGGSIIVCNGKVLAQAKQFSVDEVEVITATVDVTDVRSYRASLPSFGMQAVDSFATSSLKGRVSKVVCTTPAVLAPLSEAMPTKPTTLQYHIPEEECCLGPACWLWDYLRRSGASGYLLPLSGGADSSSVATIVGAMCHLVTDACKKDPNGPVAIDVRRICRKADDEQWIPQLPSDFASYIFSTIYMGTENSSQATKSRAQRLGESVGSYHLSVPIDSMVAAITHVFSLVTGHTPRFQLFGGSMTEDLAIQNIQARIRMVTAYLFAQLLPWTRTLTASSSAGSSSNNKTSFGFYLVLASANVDEGLRGYMTKYDCSSADLNPIGAISKGDLKRMLLWASKVYDWPVLKEIADAPPTAELRPMVEDDKDGGGDGKEHSQLDEDEMGMTYEELGLFGILRKQMRCGPVGMFRKLVVTWKDRYSPAIVAEKVLRFFRFYSINRHKMCTITPAYHAESYSPDDNRFDLRPFLYNTKWARQSAVMNALVKQMELNKAEK